jgi:hypothetical protein
MATKTKGRADNKKQEGQGNQGFQQKTQRQQEQGGKGAGQQASGQQRGPQPGSQRDRKGRIGM